MAMQLQNLLLVANKKFGNTLLRVAGEDSTKADISD